MGNNIKWLCGPDGQGEQKDMGGEGNVDGDGEEA